MLVHEPLSVIHGPEAKVFNAVSPGHGLPVQHRFANSGILVDKEFWISVDIGAKEFLEKSAIDILLRHARVQHVVCLDFARR